MCICSYVLPRIIWPGRAFYEFTLHHFLEIRNIILLSNQLLFFTLCVFVTWNPLADPNRVFDFLKPHDHFAAVQGVGPDGDVQALLCMSMMIIKKQQLYSNSSSTVRLLLFLVVSRQQCQCKATTTISTIDQPLLLNGLHCDQTVWNAKWTMDRQAQEF